ncbi:hypothetical protein OHW66_09720 [Acinetobacter baumannii]|uniref:hypothetical protein n=1 Tax=Acinetobacter baumannii TaxID=470 RepID=UPI0023421914|nr:hypothetical protein [Acinetobacter baumannii]
MGVKKLVTITVEAEIEIELPDWMVNPTKEDLEGINACGFSVEKQDDIYREAARTILYGFADSNNDVFGCFHSFWRKETIENPESKSFYEITDLHVEDYSAEAIP